MPSAEASTQLDAEEAREVLRRAATELLSPDAAQVGEEARRLDDVSRFVAPTAERHGREVRAVGLDEQAFERDGQRDFAQILRLLERDVTRERDHEAEFQNGLGHPRAAAEAVHDPAALRARHLGAKYLDRLVVGLARMNDDGQALCLRKPQLSCEHFALHLARRVVVMIIQTDLAKSDDALAAAQDREQTPLFLFVV